MSAYPTYGRKKVLGSGLPGLVASVVLRQEVGAVRCRVDITLHHQMPGYRSNVSDTYHGSEARGLLHSETPVHHVGQFAVIY